MTEQTHTCPTSTVSCPLWDRMAMTEQTYTCPQCGTEFTMTVDFDDQTISRGDKHDPDGRKKTIKTWDDGKVVEKEDVECPECGNDRDLKDQYSDG